MWDAKVETLCINILVVTLGRVSFRTCLHTPQPDCQDAFSVAFSVSVKMLFTKYNISLLVRAMSFVQKILSFMMRLTETWLNAREHACSSVVQMVYDGFVTYVSRSKEKQLDLLESDIVVVRDVLKDCGVSERIANSFVRVLLSQKKTKMVDDALQKMCSYYTIMLNTKHFQNTLGPINTETVRHGYDAAWFNFLNVVVSVCTDECIKRDDMIHAISVLQKEKEHGVQLSTLMTLYEQEVQHTTKNSSKSKTPSATIMQTA